MSAKPFIFTLTEDHIKVLSSSTVTWNDMEDGAPTLQSKKPYGSRELEVDIAEILEIITGTEAEALRERSELFQKEYPEVYGYCRTLYYQELMPALQIILYCRTFEPGAYRAIGYGGKHARKWEKYGQEEDRPEED